MLTKLKESKAWYKSNTIKQEDLNAQYMQWSKWITTIIHNICSDAKKNLPKWIKSKDNLGHESPANSAQASSHVCQSKGLPLFYPFYWDSDFIYVDATAVCWWCVCALASSRARPLPTSPHWDPPALHCTHHWYPKYPLIISPAPSGEYQTESNKSYDRATINRKQL